MQRQVGRGRKRHQPLLKLWSIQTWSLGVGKSTPGRNCKGLSIIAWPRPAPRGAGAAAEVLRALVKDTEGCQEIHHNMLGVWLPLVSLKHLY